MCGIFGYVGFKSKESVKIVLDGLKRLEYRGYDSAGIAGIQDGHLEIVKEVGKVSELQRLVGERPFAFSACIAHTRWATHGEPTEANAHPHFDEEKSLAVVHNGIIENYLKIRERLQSQGVRFRSETDTEVIAHLISANYCGNFLEAVQKTLPELEGAFSLAIVHKDHPGVIIAVAHEAPMVIGMKEQEAFISSDSHAFAPHTNQVVFLSSSEIALVKGGVVEVYTAKNERVDKPFEVLTGSAENASKGEFEHYTIKEIFEQQQTVRNAFASRFSEEFGTAVFEGFSEHFAELHSIERILILACGTSWHAGYVAAYMIEEMARIPVQVEISSEFRYKNPIVHKNTLVIAISQSGETADTLAAVRELKAKAVKIFAICNVQGSSLVREADYTFFLHAGPEIGVCSTKAFTSQLVVLSLISLFLARMNDMTCEEGIHFLTALKKLPEQIKEVLSLHKEIESLAKSYAHYENFFFLGRQYMYPTSLEGALKLKEISYVNANGYPAGEMKHGPIALIGPKCPTIALCQNQKTFDKLSSNLMEIKARKGEIFAIAGEGQEEVKKIADNTLILPKTLDPLAPILTTVATQLFAYYVAKERGENIDQPRNLAKSVTVE